MTTTTITSYTVSTIMNEMQKKAVQYIKEDGYVSPMLIVITNPHTTSHFNHLFHKFENIIDIEYIEWQNGLSIAIFYLYMRSRKDDDLQVVLSKHIATEYSTLAMGFIGQGFAKNMEDEDFIRLADGDLNLDPETIRLLLNRFFIKDNKNTYMQMIPFYVKEEKVKKEKTYDFGFDDQDQISYIVSIIPFPWSINTPSFITKNILDPYSE